MKPTFPKEEKQMAQLHLTRSQKEILLLLSENRQEAFRKLPEDSGNSIL